MSVKARVHGAALAVIAVVMGSFGPAFADAEVQMLNKAPDSNERNVFYPAIVKLQPGETVYWVATDKGHNVELVKGSVPEGTPPFRSNMNQDASFTFDKPGVYVYKCTPHYGLGMVGIVVVGDDLSNQDEVSAKRYPGKAGKRLSKMFGEISQ